MKDKDIIKDTTDASKIAKADDSTGGPIAPEKPITEKFTAEKIVEKVKKRKEKPKPKAKQKPAAVHQKENRDVPCILRFKKVSPKQAANVAHLFKKLKYRNYRISHSKGHNKWDIEVWFENLDERDKFEVMINKLL